MADRLKAIQGEVKEIKTGQSDLTQRLEKLEEAPTSKDSNDYQDIDDPESGNEDEYEDISDDEMITSLMLALKYKRPVRQ